MQNQIHELAKTLPPPRKQNTACDACRARKVKCNQLPGQDKVKHSSPYLPLLPRDTPLTASLAIALSIQELSLHATTEKKRNAAAAKRPRTLSTSSGSSQPSSSRLFALDLVEVFFQIVHSRLPLLNPAQFRSRLHYSLSTGPQPQATNESTPQGGAGQRGRNSNSPPHGGPPQKPVHPALVAVVIAWGAKFSEHPLFVADRHQNRNQSAFAKVLINRARDLAEDMKVHRMPSADHVVIALLIEPLQSQSVEDNAGFHGFWLGSAIRLLLDLQINHKSVMSNIEDPEARGTMIFAWWMACLADAYRSVYYRRKPMLDDDDYDIDFYTVGPVPPDIIESHAPQPSPREQLEARPDLAPIIVSPDPLGVDQGYYRAAHALARIARQMSRQLWRPATESDGIPLEVLNTFMSMLSEWREEHLQHVGVPSNFEAEWDFVSAVTACASDATYHIMWIILYNALEDFGIREVNDVTRTGTSETLLPQHAQIEEKKRKVGSEAQHGALRIAGLAGVLASNGYLVRPGCSVSDPRVRHR
ncbi:transcription factor [Ganoderma sinense ZZ0214-1]|uniref:Transcription factor n=1 Tax=Ganoderma sinense ZZ0214-1 TaxID=1077348 RepID=A0A2G8RMV4_9APHY|nr:transcription factor [Ganoderma sinense ZZ0214-1]